MFPTVCIVIVIVVMALMAYLVFKSNRRVGKTDEVAIASKKPADEIVKAACALASKKNGDTNDVERLPEGQIAVTLEGRRFKIARIKRWRVELLIQDEGDERTVMAVACGDDIPTQIMYSYKKWPYFELGYSKRVRDEIVRSLQG